MNLVVFADEIKSYKDENTFQAKQKKIKFSVESFFPSGTFMRDTEDKMTGVAQNIFHGKVIDFEEKENTVSGKKYYWFLCKTLGGEIDVVVDASIKIKYKNIDSVFRVSGWTVGNVL